ncbi:LysR family transcriptional regulator [Neptunomonas sp.]|uniref:LysR family transcriptional regulator n=1 Tax=Neptunomonas sp. TaxID=1971898 RepID=UPI0025DB032D|nr:LysR family transcriptional regulator [Neptunomonas sp.]
MNQLRYMSVFARIVEEGSITAAAEALHLSKSVVSQQLKALENELGILLLKRTTRRQTLTNAGESFYQQCKALNDIAETAWQQAKDTLETPQGSIRITAPDALMSSIIAPAIGHIIKKYPLLAPELISNDQHLDLPADNIDLAIRVGPSAISSMKQKRIGHFRDVLCATPAFIESGVDQQSIYIANTWQSAQICHTFTHKKTNSSFVFSTRARCKADSFNICLALIHESAGIGIIPDFLFKQITASLSEVYPSFQLPENSVYALHPYSNKVPLNVTLCLAAIENKLATAM